MNQWHSWNTHVRKIKASGRLQLDRTEITPFTTEETTPVLNLYALEKGRGKPRAG